MANGTSMIAAREKRSTVKSAGETFASAAADTTNVVDQTATATSRAMSGIVRDTYGFSHNQAPGFDRCFSGQPRAL